MHDLEKLTKLRAKLVAKRRSLVTSFAEGPVEQLTGESIARIQHAIDAVDRAYKDEERAAVMGKKIAYEEDALATEAGSAVPVAFLPNESASTPSSDSGE